MHASAFARHVSDFQASLPLLFFHMASIFQIRLQNVACVGLCYAIAIVHVSAFARNVSDFPEASHVFLIWHPFFQIFQNLVIFDFTGY